MTTTACTFSFNIAAWHAASNRLATAEQWRSWAQGSLKQKPARTQARALRFCPPCSGGVWRGGALVCEAAWDLAERFQAADGLRLARR